MGTYLITIGSILAIAIFGIVVQRLYEGFARRNPELGPFRESGGGCGACSGGSCGGGQCSTSKDD